MASFQFGLISKSLWHSKRFRSLGDPVAKLVYCYLHTNEHRNSIGCYRLRAAYASIDLDLTVEGYDRAIDALVEAGLILYDRDTEYVLIVDFFRFNPVTNPKHAAGARRKIEELPEGGIKTKALSLLFEACPYPVDGPEQIPYTKRAKLSTKQRIEIAQRSMGRCVYCGTHDAPLHIDHVIPISRGGSNEISNLVLSCAPCNMAKGIKTAEEWSGANG